MSEGRNHMIRRDLSRWSRKLLICIGLESIGSELVGERNWRHLYPLTSDLKRNERNSPTSNFDPSGPTFRNNGHDLVPLPHLDLNIPNTEQHEEDEDDDDTGEDGNGTYTLADLLPYWSIFNHAFGTASGLSSRVDHANSRQDLNVSSEINPNIFYDALDAQQLNALYLLHSLNQQQTHQDLQLQLEVNSNLQAAHLGFPFLRVPNLQEFRDPNEVIRSLRRAQHQRPQPCTSFPNTTQKIIQEMEEQPLDLTFKTKEHLCESPLGKPTRFIPEVSSSNNGRDLSLSEKHSKLNLKSSPRAGRGYTTEELAAALSDIQSGKLGTRRAAVIYGIPRSTLRNKVYKLGKDSKYPDNLKDNAVPIVVADTQQETSQESLTKRDMEPNVELSTPSPFSSIQKVIGPSSQMFWDGKTDGSGNNEGKSEEEMSHERKALKEWLKSKLSRQRLIAEGADGIEYLGNQTHSDAPRLLSDPVQTNNGEDSSTESISGETQESAENPLNDNHSPRHTNVLQRCQGIKRRSCEEDEFHPSPQTAQLSTVTSLTSPEGTAASDRSRLKHRIEEDCSMERLDHSTVGKGDGELYDALDLEFGNLSDEDGNGKKSRPKRGKYRNYDRDALAKAVKAVQNGEMSVHKAGGHFGVPHSTLEYKVKERHLRRPTRKDRGSIHSIETSKQPNQKSSPESSLSGSEYGSTKSVHIEFSPPVASTTRETLTRFLTAATSAAMRRRSLGSMNMNSKIPTETSGRNDPNSRSTPTE